MSKKDFTIDDGNGSLWIPGQVNLANLLAIRHDRGCQKPVETVNGFIPASWARGNVVFCDGHSDFITRGLANSQSSADPYW